MNLRLSRETSTRRREIVSWIVYDIGNTLFFVGIVGLFFPLWITKEKAGDDAVLGFTLAAAMVLSLITAPFIGALSDYVGRKVPFVAGGTLICVLALIMLDTGSLTLTLIYFALAVIGITTADIFYNALLFDVSTDSNRGFIGGLGVGVGYLGAIIAAAVGLILVESQGYVFAFRVVSLLILLVSLPLIFLIKDRGRPSQFTQEPAKAKLNLKLLADSLRLIRSVPGLSKFLLGRFWYTWTVNTGGTFAVLYGTTTGGFTAREVQIVLLIGIIVAIPSGLIWGKIVDKTGPYRTMKIVLTGWLVLLLLAIGIPVIALPPFLWLVLAIAAGVLVPGVWVSDRPFMLQLTPPGHMGEAFALHSMMSRLSSIVGPFMWGLVSVTLGLGQIPAVAVLAICMTIAFALIIRIPENTGTKGFEAISRDAN